MTLFDAPQPRPRGSETHELIRGMVTVWGWNLLQLAIGIFTIMIAVGAVILFVFGLVQLAYVVPMAINAKREGNMCRFEGIIIAACVTVLLNVACSTNFKIGG